MKRILTLLSAVVLTLTAVMADNTPSGNRVVLKPAREFNSVVINGNAVVECKFHPQYSGYVVYYTGDNEAPRIQVVNYETNLVITADTTANAVTSRITVVCHANLDRVVVNGGVMLSRRLPECELLTIEANGGSAFIGEIKTPKAELFNNGDGMIGVRRMNVIDAGIYGNGSGKIAVADMKAVKASVANNGSGSVTLNGKAKVAAMNVTSTGDIYAMGLRCIDLSAQVQGDGSIGCDVKNRAVVNILGNGSVMGRRYPRDIEGNVPDSFKIAPKVK